MRWLAISGIIFILSATKIKQLVTEVEMGDTQAAFAFFFIFILWRERRLQGTHVFCGGKAGYKVHIYFVKGRQDKRYIFIL
jgi:hypothetical protein